MATPTDSFIATLKQTPPLAAKLQSNIQAIKNDNDEIIKVLTYPQTVSNDLDKLDDTLTTVSDLLDVVEVVPEVGEAAAGLKDSISILSAEVSPARKAADNIESEVKPFRDALSKFDSLLDPLIKATGHISTKSQRFLDRFTAVANCVASLPDGEVKQQSQKYLDGFSTTVEPAISDLNKGLTDANDAFDTLNSALNDLKNALNPVAAIASAAESVLAVLDPLMAPLNALENALETIEIPLPLPYPGMVKLYDIFKDFSFAVDLAMKPIEGLVDDLLNALHISLPSIPGLSDLINLHINIPNLPDLPSISLNLDNLFNVFDLNMGKFTLQCPAPPGTVPVWNP